MPSLLLEKSLRRRSTLPCIALHSSVIMLSTPRYCRRRTTTFAAPSPTSSHSGCGCTRRAAAADTKSRASDAPALAASTSLKLGIEFTSTITWSPVTASMTTSMPSTLSCVREHIHESARRMSATSGRRWGRDIASSSMDASGCRLLGARSTNIAGRDC